MLQTTENQPMSQAASRIDDEEPTTSETGTSLEDLTEMERFDLETSIARLFKRVYHRIRKNLRS